jgi:hypothetical protein
MPVEGAGVKNYLHVKVYLALEAKVKLGLMTMEQEGHSSTRNICGPITSSRAP